jgi:hypothetical protein
VTALALSLDLLSEAPSELEMALELEPALEEQVPALVLVTVSESVLALGLEVALE